MTCGLKQAESGQSANLVWMFGSQWLHYLPHYRLGGRIQVVEGFSSQISLDNVLIIGKKTSHIKPATYFSRNSGSVPGSYFPQKDPVQCSSCLCGLPPENNGAFLYSTNCANGLYGRASVSTELLPCVHFDQFINACSRLYRICWNPLTMNCSAMTACNSSISQVITRIPPTLVTSIIHPPKGK